MKARSAKFAIGQVVRHRVFPFRGVIFDVDPEFNNTEEWWLSIPEEVRPRKDQPFYHLFAENAETEYIAYVSEQNLLPDHSGEPLRNPMIGVRRKAFDRDDESGCGPGEAHHRELRIGRRTRQEVAIPRRARSPAFLDSRAGYGFGCAPRSLRRRRAGIALEALAASSLRFSSSS